MTDWRDRMTIEELRRWATGAYWQADRAREVLPEIERICAENGILLPPADPGGCWRTRPEPTASAPDGAGEGCV